MVWMQEIGTSDSSSAMHLLYKLQYAFTPVVFISKKKKTKQDKNKKKSNSSIEHSSQLIFPKIRQRQSVPGY